MSRASRAPALIAVGALLLPASAGCTSAQPSVPGCADVSRLAIVAQSVPTAAYLPCVGELPAGWRVTRFDAERGGTEFALLSDRADGRSVDVRLARTCELAAATPEPPRTPGGRTYVRLSAIAPRYAGTLFDVFPGGCVSYGFDFARGPHIALMEDLFTAVELLPRRQLGVELREELGVELDP